MSELFIFHFPLLDSLKYKEQIKKINTFLSSKECFDVPVDATQATHPLISLEKSYVVCCFNQDTVIAVLTSLFDPVLNQYLIYNVCVSRTQRGKRISSGLIEYTKKLYPPNMSSQLFVSPLSPDVKSASKNYIREGYGFPKIVDRFPIVSEINHLDQTMKFDTPRIGLTYDPKKTQESKDKSFEQVSSWIDQFNHPSPLQLSWLDPLLLLKYDPVFDSTPVEIRSAMINNLGNQIFLETCATLYKNIHVTKEVSISNLSSDLDYTLFILPVASKDQEKTFYDFFILYQNYFVRKVIHIPSTPNMDTQQIKETFQKIMIHYEDLPYTVPNDLHGESVQIWNRILIMNFLNNSKLLWPRCWTQDDMNLLIPKIKQNPNAILSHFATFCLSEFLKRI